jgi:hypothetical protein
MGSQPLRPAKPMTRPWPGLSFRGIAPHLIVCFLAISLCAPATTLAADDAQLATRQCDLSQETSIEHQCAGGTRHAGVGPALAVTDYTGSAEAARSLAGTQAIVAIDAFGKARYVDNTGNTNMFVPFRSAVEWDAVIASSRFSIVPAAVPETKPRTIVPGVNCHDPSPATQPVTIPYYGRPDEAIPGPVFYFTCVVKGLCGTGTPTCGEDKLWTQSATVGFHAASTALADGTVPWSVEVTYAGTPPDPNLAPVNGVCADALGQCTIGSPSGLASANSVTTWHCTGLHGGSESSLCSAFNGSCGSDPFTCSTGTPVDERDEQGTSSWTCVGAGGGAADLCSQCDPGYQRVDGVCRRSIDGQCGSSDFSCVEGGPINQSSDGDRDYWYCSGVGGGRNSDRCTYALPKSGQCGSADWSCVVGSPVEPTTRNGTNYWMCLGINGGTLSGQCAHAVSIDGQCGSGEFACAVGSPVDQSSDGDRDYWTCSGTDGGQNSNRCVFALPKTGQCGSADWSCAVGSVVEQTTRDGTNFWMCMGVNGGGLSGQCVRQTRVDGACHYVPVTAAYPSCSYSTHGGGQGYGSKTCTLGGYETINGYSAQSPCASGTGQGAANDGATITWTCVGSGGGSNAPCSVRIPQPFCAWNNGSVGFYNGADNDTCGFGGQ